MSLERLILFQNPTMVVLISAMFVGYRIVSLDVFASVISYLRIVLVFRHDLQAGENVMLGGTLVLISAILYAAYLVYAGPMIKRIGSLRFAAYASVVSAIAIFVHCALAKGATSLLLQSSRIWELSGWMAIISTELPVLMMAEGMRRVGPKNAAMMSSIGPIATIFMGYIFLDEPLSSVQLAGAALVTFGVLATGLKKS